MFNENIPRWIITSVNKHFDDNKESLTIFFNTEHATSSDYVELRVSGPNVEEFTIDDIKCSCYINALLTSYIDKDDYEIYRMTGIIIKAFRPICVYRYGDGIDDDQTLLGTLIFIPGGRIETVHLGVIDPSSGFRRSFIEAEYQMFLP